LIESYGLLEDATLYIMSIPVSTTNTMALHTTEIVLSATEVKRFFKKKKTPLALLTL